MLDKDELDQLKEAVERSIAPRTFEQLTPRGIMAVTADLLSDAYGSALSKHERAHKEALIELKESCVDTVREVEKLANETFKKQQKEIAKYQSTIKMLKEQTNTLIQMYKQQQPRSR